MQSSVPIATVAENTYVLGTVLITAEREFNVVVTPPP